MKRMVSGRLLAQAAAVLTITAGAALIAGGKVAAGAARINKDLAATAAAPGAGGKASLNLRSATQGRFTITARHLHGRTSYDLVVGGVKVGALQTNRAGSGRAAFSTTPRGKMSLLGFDPRGSKVLVRDATTGTDDLVGDVPDDNPGAGACCLTNSEGESECEDLSPTDCQTAGGTTPMTTNPDGTQTPVTSCIPDPCGASGPSSGTVCCLNATHDDESETECEDEISQADCATAGGSTVEASSCDPNPCQPAPPVNASACCTPESGDDNEAECEVMSADACQAAGGTPNASATCEPNPCQVTPPTGGSSPSACCVVQKTDGVGGSGSPGCEELTADACMQAGGKPPANGSTSCDPNPCP